MTNLAELLRRPARSHPDRTAIISGATRLTYGDVDRASNQVANLLARRGVRCGDKVALSYPNLPSFTIIYFGILKAGAVVVPLNILLRGREIAYHLDDSDAKAYFAYQGHPQLPIGDEASAGFDACDSCDSLFVISSNPEDAPMWADQPSSFEEVNSNDDETAVILYTSGTTGQPKGAELSHQNLRTNAYAGGTMFGNDAARPDVFLCVLPLFHSFGQTCIQNGAFAFGGTLVMVERFDAGGVLEVMLENAVTVFGGVPTMYWSLLSALDETVDVESLARNLRIAMSGGAALPLEIHREFKEKFGVTILEGYGLSETSPAAAFARYGEEPRVGSIGVPIAGVEMKLINDDWTEVDATPGVVGEIAIKGHNVMKGYYKRPAATAEVIRDGWLRSGDLGRKDPDGFFYIVDRSKDMVIRGGFNVYPRELEEVLMTHPAVTLVAVIGVPHPSHGEEIKAVVVKHKGFDHVTEADIVSWGKERFAAYKYPRIVEFADELPTTSTGKILKRELH